MEMSYFDSAKNRVMWQRELEALRKERQRRAEEGYDPSRKQETLQRNVSNRVKISFAQLEREEAEASGNRMRTERGLRYQKEKSLEKSSEANITLPSKEPTL